MLELLLSGLLVVQSFVGAAACLLVVQSVVRGAAGLLVVQNQSPPYNGRPVHS